MTRKDKAFSLVEVTLAIGVIAVGIIAIVGLLPVGIQASKDAGDDTRTSAIAQDVFNRVQNNLNVYVDTNGTLPASTQSGVFLYYDLDGRFLGESTPSTPISNYTTIATALYCAQVNYGPLNTYPGVNLDPTVLSAVKVSVGWPVTVNVSAQTATVPAADASLSIYSFYLRSTLPIPSPTP